MNEKIVPLRRRRPCPICRKVSSLEDAPFCSPRCREIDLNRWLSDSYRIETNEAPENPENDPED